MSGLTSTYIFNQYYIDLLKKIKNIAKKYRINSTTAKRTLKTIKENYQTYDKTSVEYINLFKNNFNDEFWVSYINLEKEKCNEYFDEESKSSIEIYKNINIKDVSKLLRNNFILHHYISVLYIYTNELNEEEITKILTILQSEDPDIEINVENENIKKVLKRLNELKSDNIKENPTFTGMDSLKDTTIGKIAKEIIDDVDLTKIKETISNEGDIFKAIAKPDSGFGELFSNVSQKMSNKISSGELSQETIMKDAMKFASILPGLFNGNGATNNDESGGFDMNMMMNMMNMMKGMNNTGSNKKKKTGVNNEALRSMMKKNNLKKKLLNNNN